MKKKKEDIYVRKGEVKKLKCINLGRGKSQKKKQKKTEVSYSFDTIHVALSIAQGRFIDSVFLCQCKE